jgi:hypothetical protein
MFMRSSRFVALALAGAVGIGAISCSSDSSTNTAAPTTAVSSMNGSTDAMAVGAVMTAADLRSQLTVVFNEHVVLAADATNAAPTATSSGGRFVGGKGDYHDRRRGNCDDCSAKHDLHGFLPLPTSFSLLVKLASTEKSAPVTTAAH